ncbi:hypothetical protein [Chengkuizengella axinellae]|uniref:Uncharacterized protein n=1 Tax=Chengkuizengella axinellae TaxID=3064388 RepID=A0ABT9IWC0_9BACL|nr:hypothetical protein [Chengkuizengella sp. 2205SS18-9]MDP5273646.1 hypothetical protein [Chengkuizengella sp. 2205SS18-9]
MAKSKAKKIREKLEREGKRNPNKNRSAFAMIDMRTRKTKTKKDYLYHNKHKNQHIQKENVGSFLILHQNLLPLLSPDYNPLFSTICTTTNTTNNADNLSTKGLQVV